MHERAGTTARPEDLIDVAALQRAYSDVRPDPSDPNQKVAFGTSGHRGSSFDGSFNEAHVLAITQAIAEHRLGSGISGPLFLGRDTHGLSEPAWRTAIEVLVANEVDVRVDARGGYTPTPAVSHAILQQNRAADAGVADGVLITPSHNPPRDGGFKYNPPSGGPAGSEVTNAIAARANELLAQNLRDVRRSPFERARRAVRAHDFMGGYVDDLPSVIDVESIRAAGVRLAADPLGGASVEYWGAIGERHGLNISVMNPQVDPRWAFMPLDHDGKIRMDCSSPAAMANLVAAMQPNAPYDVATGHDADADRHGIVTRDGGLMNPNHYIAVAIAYLFRQRPDWSRNVAVGKTLVSSSMIDRVVEAMGRRLVEVPVGFKHFVSGLMDGSIGFGGEESAGATFLRRDGSVWTTDKDGILLGLLAAEIVSVTGKTPSELYRELTLKHGAPSYARIDAPATLEEKARLAALSPEDVTSAELAGEPIRAVLTRAPGNGEAIGGLKVITGSAWFAARPSGTEDVYKIYAESFLGPEHLRRVQAAALDLVATVVGA